MNLQNADYCFINVIYKSQKGSDDDLYELVLSNEAFTDVALLCVDIQQLRDIHESTKSLKDWKFQEGYLCCDPDVGEVILTSLIEERKGKIVSVECSPTSLFGLLQFGAQAECVILDTTVAESADVEWCGAGVTSFAQIRFSQSTMSCYVQMYDSENQLYNKMLVVNEGGVLRLQPFYFGVPLNKLDQMIDCGLDCNNSCRCQKKVNDIDYKIYQAGNLPVFEKSLILSRSLINKAECMRMRSRDVSRGVQRYVQHYYSALGQSSKTTWSGGTQSYKDDIGVYFVSSYKAFSNSKLDSLTAVGVKEVLPNLHSIDEVRSAVGNLNLGPDETYFVQMLSIGLLLGQADSSGLGGLYTIKNFTDRVWFFADLYLYKVRIYMFLTKAVLVGGGAYGGMVLTGGCEQHTTIVEGYYDE